MGQFTIAVPDDKVAGLVDAFATQYNYQEEVDDGNGVMIPNPVSKAKFAKNVIKSFVKEVFTAAKLKAIETTRQELIVEAKTDMTDVDVT